MTALPSDEQRRLAKSLRHLQASVILPLVLAGVAILASAIVGLELDAHLSRQHRAMLDDLYDRNDLINRAWTSSLAAHAQRGTGNGSELEATAESRAMTAREYLTEAELALSEFRRRSTAELEGTAITAATAHAAFAEIQLAGYERRLQSSASMPDDAETKKALDAEMETIFAGIIRHLHLAQASADGIIDETTGRNAAAEREFRYDLSLIMLLLGLAYLTRVIMTFERHVYSPLRVISSRMAELHGDFAGDLDIIAKNSVDYIGQSLTAVMRGIETMQRDYNEKKEQLGQTIVERNRQNRDLSQTKAAILNVLEDVNETKENLREERDKLAVILKSIGEAVLVADRTGRILFINPAACRLLRTTSQAAAGREAADLLRITGSEADAAPQRIIEQALNEGRASETDDDALLRLPSVEEGLPIAATASPFFSSDGKVAGTVVALRDVTTERETDRLKSEFISHASHQLRTPITSARWLLEMMLEDTQLSGERRVDLEKTLGVIVRASGVINTLLKVSRIDARSIALRPSPINLPAVVQAAAAELDETRRAKSLEFTVDIPDGIADIKSDEALLEEIFANLISNAFRYTPDGGKVSVTAEDGGDSIKINVADTGMGIPLDEQERLFTKFFRASNARLTHKDGNGLGLYIIKQLAEMIGGDISFTSETDRGTTFTLRLPKEMRPVSPADAQNAKSLRV